WVMLMQLPEAADFTKSDKARRRILPDVTTDKEAKELVDDWREFVVPDLESQFNSAVQTVTDDLDMAEESEDDEGNVYHSVEIPNDHGETWYQVLNQARLILNEEHDVEGTRELLMSGEENPSEINEEKVLTFLQFRVYAAIQEFILTNLMGVDD
ncbi:MAG: DUF2017 family protein, partial [Verrucomicrobiota bacterium]